MSESDHTQTPPPDAALPGEGVGLHESLTRMKNQIAALTAQNAALVAERDALVELNERLNDYNDELLERPDRDRIEALEWAQERATVYGRGRVAHEIEAEISRLKAQGEGE